MLIDQNLIFDLGLHKGRDAKFYLAKGFDVVGVEAVPALASIARVELLSFIKKGKLSVVERALSTTDDETVTFYVNPDKDDWGSLDKGAAEKGGVSTEIKVRTISLKTLFTQFGIPRYIKCDLEGGDSVFVRDLLKSEARPDFVSIEFNQTDDIDVLASCGYDRFQIVNQWLNPYTRPPNPSKEGSFADYSFDGETSGLFGLELPRHKWKGVEETIENLSMWKRLRVSEDNLAWGWVDVHATTQSRLF